MKVIELESETRSLAKLLGLARTQPVVFTKKGRPVAALVDVANEDLETLALRSNIEFQNYLRDVRARHDREGGASLEDVRSEHGLSRRARTPARTKPKP